MVLFNYSTKELTAKVVYYGPGLCGKTTNLQWIHEKLPIKNKGKMLSLATETDRTLFFDFLPIELGSIRGMKTRIQLYTVPGQVFYNATRRMVLKGADCLVFVCDSQEPMLDANLESLENLRQNLEANEIDPDEIPMVLQYNKRDLPNALPIEILNEKMNPRGLPFHEAVAIKGIGVDETLKSATALVFKSLASRYGAVPPVIEAEPATRPAPPGEEAPPPPPLPEAPASVASPRGEDDFLEALELQPTSDVIDDDESRAVVEGELGLDAELNLNGADAVEPLTEADELLREVPVASRAFHPADTVESPPDEAKEIRRQIAGPLIPEVSLDELEEEEQEIEEMSLDAPPLASWSPEDTPATSSASPTPTVTAPLSVDLTGPAQTDIAIPLEVVLNGGITQVQINLRLNLKLKLPQ